MTWDEVFEKNLVGYTLLTNEMGVYFRAVVDSVEHDADGRHIIKTKNWQRLQGNGWRDSGNMRSANSLAPMVVSLTGEFKASQPHLDEDGYVEFMIPYKGNITLVPPIKLTATEGMVVYENDHMVVSVYGEGILVTGKTNPPTSLVVGPDLQAVPTEK